MTTEIDTAPDLSAAASIDAAAASEPDLSAEVAKAMPVRRRVRPLTSEGKAMQTEIAALQVVAEEAQAMCREALDHAKHFRSAFYFGTPIALAAGVAIGRFL